MKFNEGLNQGSISPDNISTTENVDVVSKVNIDKPKASEQLVKKDDYSSLYEEYKILMALISAEKKESKKEEIRKKLRLNRKKTEFLDNERDNKRREKEESHYVYTPYIFKESEEEKKERVNREKERKYYSDNYKPNLVDLGFNESELNEPEKWQPGEHQEEQQLINKAEFSLKEIIEGAIDEAGNIKNAGVIFRQLFYDKISLILGKEFAENCIDNNSYIQWKEGEMQNDLSKFINDSRINKKDIEKVIAVRFIGDIIYDLVDDEGNFHINSFVSNSLINRLKNKNASILEKYFIKNIIYEIIKIENYQSYKYGSIANKKIKDMAFLNKEIGANFYPDKYQDKSFNKFDFQFNQTQKEAILSKSECSRKEEMKPINYYRDNNIKIHWPHSSGEYAIECYVTSLVAPGIVGVYSKDGLLIGWENTEDLKEESINTINDVLQINKDNNIKIEDLALFKVSSSLGFRGDIQKMFNVDLSKFNIKNQFYFLNFIQGKTEDGLTRFKKFIKKSNTEEEKINKLRTFLSIEQGGKEMWDKILALGDSEKLSEDLTKKIFAKYGGIIDTADNTEEEIRKIFGDKEIPTKVLSSVKETLLKRGAKMLSDLGDKALDPKYEVNEIEILKELDEIKEETIILGKSYYELFKEGIRVPIEEVTTIKETSAIDFTTEQKGELLKIYEKGRPKVTYERMEHLEFLKEEFKNELNDKNTSIFEICFNKETIIIALVDKKDNDTLHIGGLTFVEDVKNAVVAEASMSYVLKKFENKNIKALVDSRNPLLNMYLNRFGFKITKKLDSPEEIRDNGGAIYYEVEKTKDLQINEKVEDREELLKEAA